MATETICFDSETICFDSETICFDSNSHVGGVKTISYKQLVVDLLAVKLQLRVLLTKLSDVCLNVSPLLKSDYWKPLLVTGATVIFTANN